MAKLVPLRRKTGGSNPTDGNGLVKADQAKARSVLSLGMLVRQSLGELGDIGMRLMTALGAEELSTDTIAALKSRYPTKDVGKELHAMHLWLLRYPKRRPANVWRFMDTWLKKSPNVVRPPATTMFGWWTSDERTVNQGHALGMAARPGESMAQFRDRISAKLANG